MAHIAARDTFEPENVLLLRGPVPVIGASFSNL
jgi:hypothetical protein